MFTGTSARREFFHDIRLSLPGEDSSYDSPTSSEQTGRPAEGVYQLVCSELGWVVWGVGFPPYDVAQGQPRHIYAHRLI